MRKNSIDLYVAAFIITTIIFLAGIYVGSEMSKSVGTQLFDAIEKVSQSTLSLELLLLSDESSDFCPVYISELNRIDSETENIGYQLSYLEEVQEQKNPELKKQYFYLELNSYILSEKVSSLCDLDYDFVLYFYSPDCDDCTTQGEDLLKLKEDLGSKIRIYSFDGTLDSPVVESFKDKFNIQNYPTLVVNGVKKGLKDKEELLNILE